tara:strand:+ start:159 stop:404 length:246 start_codon:yes stop_codon:yes gene_type:complete
VYSAAVRAASNEAARGRRRKINNEKRFCALCLTHHAPKKKGKRGDYMDREREREISNEKRGEIFFNFITEKIQFTFFNRIF